jgi:hypothetical protein
MNVVVVDACNVEFHPSQISGHGQHCAGSIAAVEGRKDRERRRGESPKGATKREWKDCFPGKKVAILKSSTLSGFF